MRTLFITFAIAFQLFAGSAGAQQNPILVKNVAETEIEVKNPQGVVEKKRMPLDKATPGTEVIYTTTFTNQGSKPAGNIAITNPLPNDTIYVAGSGSVTTSTSRIRSTAARRTRLPKS